LAAQPPGDFKVPFPEGSLGYFSTATEPGAKPAPLVAVLSRGFERAAASAGLESWRKTAAARGWLVMAPYGQQAGKDILSDAVVRMLEAVLKDARQRLGVDPSSIYLVAPQLASPMAFYVASRSPDLIAAALAWGGSPSDAIETNRLFGANTANTPVLWATEPGDPAVDEPYRRKLLAAGYNLAIRSTQGFTVDAALDWLAQFHLRQYPSKVDCETGSLSFARCYWVQVARFDPNLRNDALSVSRVTPGSGAYLALGGFGYKVTAPGPGVLVEWLPDGYRGPLRLQDRVVAFAGQELPNAAAFVAVLERQLDERNVALMIQRGGQRQRVETRVLLPKREENFTARVQAEYFPDTSEVLAITRGVAELRLDLPAHWVPSEINWNGNVVGKAAKPGCWLVTAGAPARPCGQ
jgi:dienelactone hydrolase